MCIIASIGEERLAEGQPGTGQAMETNRPAVVNQPYMEGTGDRFLLC